MRIAYIGIKGLPSQFGADRVVEAVAERLSNEHEITVYGSRQYTCSDNNYRFSGLRLIPIKPLPGKYTHMTSVDLLSALHAVLYGDYDLIHLHHFEASFILPILKLRYKVIATAHGEITDGNKWGKTAVACMQLMEIPFMRLSDIPTCVSLPLAKKLQLRFNRKVYYIPNGVDPFCINGLQNYKLNANAFETGGNHIVFAAGRIMPLKGVHLLLEAFQNIDFDCRLLIIGDLSGLPKFAEQLKSLADSRVSFIPFISSKEKLLNLIQSSKLFIFPSLQEGMSMMLLESASTGTPILHSDIPENLAVLSSQALSFRSGNVNDLREKIKWALGHPQELKELGKRTKEWVQAKYNWDTITEQYEKLYNKLTMKDPLNSPLAGA